MTWVAVAIGGAAVVGAVGSNMAAGKQASGQQASAATQQHMFDTINAQEQPFIKGGYGAETKLNDLLGTSGNTGAAGYGSLTQQFTPTDFLNNLDPGYGFQLQQGDLALQSANSAGGSALSGPALKSLMSFNQGMAATGYQNAFNRFTTQQNNIFGRLSQIAGLGQSAATQVGTAGTSLGTGIGQAQAAAAGSSAAGIVGATNAIGGAGVPLAALLGSGSSSYSGMGGGGAGTLDAGGGYTFNTGGY